MSSKLLLADDSITIQRVIELTFADEDIQVVAVGDGDQAIARIDAEPPDIVLADVGMPGRDGYEVAAHVKRTPRLAHIPVVLLTGAFEPVDQARAAEVGSDGVLAKPFEPQLVIARVKELLDRRTQPGTVAAAQAPPPATLAPPAQAPGSQPVSSSSTAEADAHLDAYFDRLDAAFATLSSQPAAAPARPAPATEMDWFDTETAGNPPDLPLSYASPPPPAAAPAGASPAHMDAPTFAAPQPPALPVVPASAVPALADAFAAILAVEQADPAAASAAWPSATPEVSDAVVDEVVRRVLERLSDRVVRETVTGIVAGVTERLVRDEIERIKSSIK